MGTKKKPVKKSKSKSKKHAVSKHVDRSPDQEVPQDEESENTDLSVSEMETQSLDEGRPPSVTVPDICPPEDETVDTVVEREVDEKVPDLDDERSEPKLKPSPICHQRIEELKQGGRKSAKRKLSLQVATGAAKQDTRRVSLADLKQMKHPLQDTWTFWYYMGNKGKQWNENLRQVCKVATVEDFWCLYNDLICPSQLTPGKDFSFFKRHVRPEWEDSANQSGGMWSFCPREKNHRSSDMDKVWLELLLFLIGDQFDILSQYVNGVSYSKRKAQDRISLWIGTEFSRSEEILKIGHAMKQAIAFVTQSFKLEYSTSDDWRQKTGSSVTVRYSL